MPENTFLTRWLLRLYPQEYRARYGPEIAGLIEQELRESGGGMRFRLRLFADHLNAARRVRMRARRAGRGETMLQDLRWAVRSLVRARGFTVFATLTLGLGVGATASVYTVLDRVVLRPLPWEGSERLVQVGTYILGGDEIEVLSQPLLRDFIDGLDGVEALVGASGARPVLTGSGEPVQLSSLEVSPGYFDFFDGAAAAGRLLRADDHAADGELTAVLGHAFWQETYGSDPAVIGETLELDGEVFTVVGVLAPDFTAPRPDYWNAHDVIVPMGLYRKELYDGAFGVRSAARLEPGVSIEDLEVQLTRIGLQRYEDLNGFVTGFGARPLEEMVVGEEIRRSLTRVLGAVGLLLLIGCVNVASLLLTRASQRADELRLRAAIGATRARLFAQLIAESSLLALAGGVVGGGIAWVGVDFFRRNAPEGIPRLAEVALDPAGFAMAMGISLMAVLFFGLLPAWTTSRSGSLQPSRKRHGSTRQDRTVRGGLVLLETALAVVLVIWSGLLSRDLIAMSTEDAGFRSEGLVAGQVDLRGRADGGTAESRQDFLRRLAESASAIPGVRRVAFATELPYSGNSLVSMMMPEGYEDEPEGQWMPMVAVEGDYFDAFGIRFVEGRPFDTTTEDELQYAVVNEAFVDRYWPGENPLGRTIKSGGPDVDDEGSYEVIGVVADVRIAPGAPTPPKMYTDYTWESFSRVHVVLEIEGASEAVLSGLRSAVSELDAGLPLTAVTTLEAVAEQAMVRPVFYATIFSTFGITALLLALIGVYGTTSYATAARSREIGIRVALGEERERIVGAILRRTALVVGGGVLLGSAGAAASGRIASDALLLVGTVDPVTYGSVAVLVLAAALVAAWLPARSLTRVDPADTLRREV